MDSDNPADYNLDEQLTDLMDYTCEGISEWIDSNDYGGLSPWVAWNYVFGPYDLW